MNEKQERFLMELDELFTKYNISSVFSTDDGAVNFASNGDMLRFKTYNDRTFKHLHATQFIFSPTKADNKTAQACARDMPLEELLRFLNDGVFDN